MLLVLSVVRFSRIFWSQGHQYFQVLSPLKQRLSFGQGVQNWYCSFSIRKTLTWLTNLGWVRKCGNTLLMGNFTSKKPSTYFSQHSSKSGSESELVIALQSSWLVGPISIIYQCAERTLVRELIFWDVPNFLKIFILRSVKAIQKVPWLSSVKVLAGLSYLPIKVDITEAHTVMVIPFCAGFSMTMKVLVLYSAYDDIRSRLQRLLPRRLRESAHWFRKSDPKKTQTFFPNLFKTSKLAHVLAFTLSLPVPSA